MVMAMPTAAPLVPVVMRAAAVAMCVVMTVGMLVVVMMMAVPVIVVMRVMVRVIVAAATIRTVHVRGRLGCSHKVGAAFRIERCLDCRDLGAHF